MNNSNGKVKASYDKRLSFTATGILLIWILIIIFGIFSLINAFLLFNMPVIWAWTLSFVNPFVYIVFIIGFFPSRSISISLIDLFKNRRWIEPSRFIKGIFIQLVTAAIASILTIIIYNVNNFTDFFSLFLSFAFLFPIQFLLFCLYYYRYDLPERQNYNNPNLLRRY
jgi:hypothetical protein